jgi:hypothetical protein
MLHPKLQAAIDEANRLMVEMTSNPESERARLEKLTKAQLIDEILKAKKLKDCKVEDLVYAIMGTTACAALSYAMIAAIVVKYRPGKTKAANISWYASKAIEKDKDIVPRLCNEEFNKLVMSSAV